MWLPNPKKCKHGSSALLFFGLFLIFAWQISKNSNSVLTRLIWQVMVFIGTNVLLFLKWMFSNLNKACSYSNEFWRNLNRHEIYFSFLQCWQIIDFRNTKVFTTQRICAIYGLITSLEHPVHRKENFNRKTLCRKPSFNIEY